MGCLVLLYGRLLAGGSVVRRLAGRRLRRQELLLVLARGDSCLSVHLVARVVVFSHAEGR